MVKKCPNCNNDCVDDATTCEQCGYSFFEKVQSGDDEKKHRGLRKKKKETKPPIDNAETEKPKKEKRKRHNQGQDAEISDEISHRPDLCPRCLASIPSDSHFCPNCGNQVKDSEADLEHFQIDAFVPACPQCGLNGFKGISYCPHCGYEYSESDVIAHEKLAKNPKKICIHCFFKAPIDSKYCPLCGTQFGIYDPEKEKALEKLPTVTTNKETTQIGPESPETEKMKSEEVLEDKFTVKKNIADSIEKTLRMPKIHEGVSEDTVRYLRQCANPYCRCITNGKKAVCPLCGEDLDSTNYSISKSKFSEGKIKLSPPSLYSCYMDALKRAGWYSYIYLIMALLELGLCVSIKNDEVGGDLSLLIALLSSGAFGCAYLAHILEIDVRSQVLMVLFGVFLNIILGTFDLIILLEGYLCVWIIDILMLIGLFSILVVHPGKIYTSVTPGLTEDQYDEHEYGIYENMEEDE